MPPPRVSRPANLRLVTDEVGDTGSLLPPRGKGLPRRERLEARDAPPWDSIPADVREAMDYLLRRIAAASKRK